MTLPAPSIPAASVPDPDSEKESSPKAFIAVIGLAILVVVLCGLGAALSGVFDFGPGSPDTDVATSDDPNRDQPPKVPGTTFSDGQWLVGADIEAGTYSVTVGPESPGCTWEAQRQHRRRAQFGARVREFGSSSEALVVNIRVTDKIFQSVSCGTWSRTSD